IMKSSGRSIASSSRLPEMYHITTLSPLRIFFPPSSVSTRAVRRICDSGVCQRMISETILPIRPGSAFSFSHSFEFWPSARTPPVMELRVVSLPPTISNTIAAFAEHGLGRATHSHVAKRAGVSVPAVHSYFRTRDDLVAAVLDEVEAFLLKLNSETLSNSQFGVREALELLATRFAREALEKPDIVKVWLDWSTGVRADVW